MSAAWIEIEGPSGVRRAPVLAGLTRIGGAGADIRLEDKGSPANGDELQVWDSPPRMLFVGRGARPTYEGQTFEERALAPGDRVAWNGHRLTYGTEDAPVARATAPPSSASSSTSSSTSSARFAERVRAAFACELGLADAQAVKRWRASARSEGFDPDACARELVPTELGAEAERRLLERAASLQRDSLSAPTSAPSVAPRAAPRRQERAASPGVFTFLLIQVLSFLVFAALVAAILYVLRLKGISIDAHLDRLMERFRPA